MSGALTLYDKARKALGEARRVDEVKDVLDKAAALKAYARQARDEQLMADASVIHKRATRRLGEVMDDQRQAGEMSKGAATTRGKKSPASLEAQGVDKDLAKRARAAASMPEEAFEAEVAKIERLAVATVVGDKGVLSEARAERQAEKKARRQQREAELGARIAALPDKKYGVIVADPAWKFQVYSDETGMDRSAENHYPTSDLAAIKAIDVASIAADDCALFLWATAPMLPEALEVMAAWGFAYKSNFVWVKDKIGTGYWSRNRHELLLLGVRGKVPAPAMGEQSASAVFAEVGEHSAKPEIFLEMVESYFPSLPKIELNRRGPPREKWDAWGLESEQPGETTP